MDFKICIRNLNFHSQLLENKCCVFNSYSPELQPNQGRARALFPWKQGSGISMVILGIIPGSKRKSSNSQKRHDGSDLTAVCSWGMKSGITHEFCWENQPCVSSSARQEADVRRCEVAQQTQISHRMNCQWFLMLFFFNVFMVLPSFRLREKGRV